MGDLPRTARTSSWVRSIGNYRLRAGANGVWDLAPGRGRGGGRHQPYCLQPQQTECDQWCRVDGDTRSIRRTRTQFWAMSPILDYIEPKDEDCAGGWIYNIAVRAKGLMSGYSGRGAATTRLMHALAAACDIAGIRGQEVLFSAIHVIAVTTEARPHKAICISQVSIATTTDMPHVGACEVKCYVGITAARARGVAEDTETVTTDELLSYLARHHERLATYGRRAFLIATPVRASLAHIERAGVVDHGLMGKVVEVMDLVDAIKAEMVPPEYEMVQSSNRAEQDLRAALLRAAMLGLGRESHHPAARWGGCALALGEEGVMIGLGQ
ncbi:hypothetical protein DM02DRAFT_734303 [Periconia macrospinosa]|uniref:Uncharacterized protein n=1 Tax=Periconia macrospinosa TaxID=97972 RepID=A0A2V1CZ93_9PLEO|nr:hypothetical protein DM02DRAFT_734303 [Periconia macrospinosa]